MPDAGLGWGGDLVASPAGDVQLVEGAALGQERVLRRLLTNMRDYSWQPAYGGGLGQFVGAVANGRSIEGAVRAQLYAEAAVAHRPQPAVATAALPDGSVFVDIAYTDAPTQQTQILTFTLGA